MAEEKEEVIVGSPDIHYEPVVKLKEVDVKTLEDEEEELLKMRAKLYRFTVDEEDGPQWKDRGSGEVKILCHKDNKGTRLVMRRDKTLKICANHMLVKGIELKTHGKSERAFVWVTEADYADEEPKRETLAIRLANKEAAEQFKEIFERAVSGITRQPESAGDDLEHKLSELKVTDASDAPANDSKNTEVNKEQATTETITEKSTVTPEKTPNNATPEKTPNNATRKHTNETDKSPSKE